MGVVDFGGYMKDWLLNKILKWVGIDRTTFDAILELINLLGSILGGEDEARQWVRKFNRKVYRVKERQGARRAGAFLTATTEEKL